MKSVSRKLAYGRAILTALSAVLSGMVEPHSAIADEVPSPVVLVYPSDVGFHAMTLGILGDYLVDQFMNHRGATQMQAFQEATAEVKWADIDMSGFACIGIPAGQPCRQLLRFDGEESGLLKELKAKEVRRAWVISIMQMFDGRRYRSRATLRDTEIGDKSLRTRRTLSAICESDIPMAAQSRMKNDAAAMRSYWIQGEPSTLERVGRESLTEMARMLEVLNTAYPDESMSAPNGWNELKKVDEFEKAGRLKCHGWCGGTTRVFRDGDSRVWLTGVGGNGRGGGMYGLTLVSLDRDTALLNSNFLAYVQTPFLN
jgi:hypothetical protein